MELLTLDFRGVGLAIVIGVAMLLLGGTQFMGWFFVVAMIYFLAISAIVTRLGSRYKKRANLYQKARGVRNVLGNGLGPLIFVVVFYYFSVYGQDPAVYLVTVAAFLSSVAAVASDKFSSEIGVLDGTPTSIVTFKEVKKGESGGITALGLGAGTIGAALIAVTFLAVPGLSPTHEVELVAIVLVGGIVGTIVDSFLGHFEEKGIGNKHLSNFLCSLAGGVVGALLVSILL